MIISGTQVVVSANATKKVGGKTLPFKRWMRRRCYHARVQKKWDARYGPVKFEPTVYLVKNVSGEAVYIMHPDLYEALKANAR